MKSLLQQKRDQNKNKEMSIEYNREDCIGRVPNSIKELENSDNIKYV